MPSLGLFDYVLELVVFFFLGLAVLFSPLNPFPAPGLD